MFFIRRKHQKKPAPCIVNAIEAIENSSTVHQALLQLTLQAADMTKDEYRDFLGHLGKGINYIYNHADYKQCTPDSIDILVDNNPFIRFRPSTRSIEISSGFLKRYNDIARDDGISVRIPATGDLKLDQIQAITLSGVEEAYHAYQHKYMQLVFSGLEGSAHLSREEHDNHPIEIDAVPVIRQAAVDLNIAPSGYWPEIKRNGRVRG